MIQIVDAKKVEWEYANSKFPNSIELIDLEAQNVYIKTVMISMLKCIYSFNYYGHRDVNTNKDIVNNECPRYSYPESWDNVVKYKETAMFRSEF